MSVLSEIKVPLLAVNDTILTVVNIYFDNGALVNKGVMLLEFETSKTTYEVESEASGYIEYLCKIGGEYEVDQVVARIVSSREEVNFGAAKKIMQDAPAVNARPLIETTWSGTPIFSSEALRLMQKNKLDASQFSSFDLVSLNDVKKHLHIEVGEIERKQVLSKPAATTGIDLSKVELEKISSSKKREISYLSDVQSSGLTSTVNSTIDTEYLFVNINRSLKYLKNSLLPVMIYEVSRLLSQYSILNAYYVNDGIARYKNVNVGFAVDLDKGLKVLKIAGADEKSITAIEDDIMNLSGKYLDDKLSIDDLSDISFTITDLSGEAVDSFRPLVNSRNSAILGISAIDKKLQRCVLSITFDHRVTEGKTVARFLGELKSRLESYRAFAKDRLDIHCYKCQKSIKEDLSNIGFAKVINKEGADVFVCQTCFKGF